METIYFEKKPTSCRCGRPLGHYDISNKDKDIASVIDDYGIFSMCCRNSLMSLVLVEKASRNVSETLYLEELWRIDKEKRPKIMSNLANIGLSNEQITSLDISKFINIINDLEYVLKIRDYEDENIIYTFRETPTSSIYDIVKEINKNGIGYPDWLDSRVKKLIELLAKVNINPEDFRVNEELFIENNIKKLEKKYNITLTSKTIDKKYKEMYNMLLKKGYEKDKVVDKLNKYPLIDYDSLYDVRKKINNNKKDIDKIENLDDKIQAMEENFTYDKTQEEIIKLYSWLSYVLDNILPYGYEVNFFERIKDMQKGNLNDTFKNNIKFVVDTIKKYNIKGSFYILKETYNDILYIKRNHHQIYTSIMNNSNDIFYHHKEKPIRSDETLFPPTLEIPVTYVFQ